MLIPCEKHVTVHDMIPSDMADLISYYQHHWVAASYQPDALPVLTSISSETEALRSICPVEDLERINADQSRERSVGHVKRMRRLRETFKDSR